LALAFFGCGTDWAKATGAGGARGTPAGKKKQRWLQRAKKPQFSPFGQPGKVKKLLRLLKPARAPSVPETKGTCWNYVDN
jgi:hypothetical protein